VDPIAVVMLGGFPIMALGGELARQVVTRWRRPNDPADRKLLFVRLESRMGYALAWMLGVPFSFAVIWYIVGHAACGRWQPRSRLFARPRPASGADEPVGAEKLAGAIHDNLEPALSHQHQMKSSDQKVRVLLVDDYADTREMYAAAFSSSQFDLVQAESGLEAIQRALECAPDVILMDLSLPVMDGWEATDRLKADARTAGIPVIALSGHALADWSERARQVGFDGFLTKPCLPDTIEAEILRVLNAGAART
jgi:two-component system cell cycle response regulator DivK